VTPVFGFFFSWRVLSAQPVSGAHAVELADTHRETEALRNAALDLATCGRRVILTVIQQKGEDLPAQFNRVAVALLDEGVLAFVLDTLEEPIYGSTMHRNRAASSCL